MSSLINKPKLCEPFHAVFPACVRTLAIQTTAPDEAVTFVFTKFNGNKYLYDSITDIDGVALIDLSEFPSGLFNPYNGSFSVYAYRSGYSPNIRLDFETDFAYYPSLVLSVDRVTYVNTPLPEPFILDMIEYVCCCSNVCGFNRCDDEN